MTAKEQEQKLGALVEQKILEFLGDPDSGLELKKNFIVRLQKNMRQKNRKLASHADVLKKYGFR
ncbi:MAG TPA: hypothetical protein VJJ20_00205 [Candidatus Paceibacterota bacterium]